MKKVVMISAGLLFACAVTKAQTDQIPWSIGFHGGLTQYSGDKGSNFYSLDQAAYGFGQLSFSRYLNRHFDATMWFTRGEIGNMATVSNTSSLKEMSTRHFRASINTGNVALRFNVVGPQAPVRPYIFAGVGGTFIEKKYTFPNNRVDASLPFGAGITFRLGDYMGLQIQETFMYSASDAIDRQQGAYNDMFLFHTAGLFFNVGVKPDTDKDGVTDKKDNCGDTPSGVAVDVNGCPVDTDKDGVADYVDNCPDMSGTTALNGCPDKDGDGLADKDDRCPDVQGPFDLKGCPDTDKDGVIDIADACPGTVAGYKVDVNGCALDNDADKIVNEEDRCPDAAGPMALNGCPDSDNDGLSDADDRCPKVAGNAANKGCPEIPKTEIQRITVIASKIFFETGKAKLKVESEAQLDELVVILNKYPEANLVIEGHTDNVGEDAFNMDLSQRRADAVKAYLVSKGISPARLTSIGYGETKPVADNSKSSGRAKNRRVELKTTY